MIRPIIIALGTTHVTGKRKISAHVYGNWAAHPALHGSGWTVTHVPSGCSSARMAADLTEGDAIALAQALDRRGVKIGVRDARSPRFHAVASAHITEATIAEFLGEGQVSP